MAENSLIVDWDKSPSFWNYFNINFKVADMEGASSTVNYKIVLASSCDDNIKNNISTAGVLNGNVSQLGSINCKLQFTQNGNDWVISNSSTVTYNKTGVNKIKGIFLCNSSNYVIGYCIFNNQFNFANKLVFDGGLSFFSNNEVD